MRLDDEKLEALRRWGQALREGHNQEYAAVGRAILLLIEEIERLRLELLRAREQLSGVEVPAENLGDPVAATLHGRVQQVLRPDPESSTEFSPEPLEEAGPDVGRARTATSPQSWIEALRRQK